MDQLKEAVESIPQRGRTTARHLLVSTLSALTFGLTGGVVGSTLFPNAVGPLIPYLVCSCSGFIFGSISYYQTETRMAVDMATKYPALIQHYLEPQFVTQGVTPFNLKTIMKERGDLTTLSMGQMAWVVMATQLACGDLDEIKTRKTSKLIDELVVD